MVPLSGLRRGGLTGRFLGLGGLALLARATTDLPLARLTGVRAGRAAVRVQNSIAVTAAPG